MRTLIARAVVWLLLLLLVTADPALAQRGHGGFPYKVGDKVFVERFNERQVGTVVEIINDSGWARIDTGDGFPHIYTPDDISLPPKKASPATSDPFSTPEERAAQEKPRTWSDASGKFRVDATLLRVADGKAVLKRADGKEVSVPIKRLSEADQKYLAEFTGEGLDDPAELENGAAVPIDDFEITEVESASAEVIDTTHTDEWSYRPDAILVTSPPLARVALGSLNPHESIEDIFVIAPTTRAYVVVKNPFGNSRPGEANRRVMLLDWSKRKLESQMDYLARQRPADMSPDGTRLISLSDRFGHGGKSTVHVFDLNGLSAQFRKAFIPFPHGHGNKPNDVDWAQLLDADHLLTAAAFGGRMILWEISEAPRAVYSLAIEGGFARPALSANRRYLAVLVPDGILILESLSGKKVGHLALSEHAPFSRLAWRSDGRRLAMVSGGRVRVWDLDSRELTRDFAIVGSTHCERLNWVDANRLLLDSHTVVDVELRIPIESNNRHDSPAVLAGGALWMVDVPERNAPPALATVKVPSDSAREKAAKLKAEDLLVVRPGMEVSIEVQGVPDRQMVIDLITNNLVKAGLKVVAQESRLKLQAAIRQGERVEIEYRGFGSFQSSRHSVVSQVMTLTFLLDGKPVWQSGGGAMRPPGVLLLQQGETVDQALAREMRQDPAWFGGMWIPSWVAIPPGYQLPAPPPGTPVPPVPAGQPPGISA